MRTIVYPRQLTTKILGLLGPEEKQGRIEVIDNKEAVDELNQERDLRLARLRRGYKFRSFESFVEELDNDPSTVNDRVTYFSYSKKDVAENSERLHEVVSRHLLNEDYGDSFATIATELKIRLCAPQMKERLRRTVSEGRLDSDRLEIAVKQLEQATGIVQDEELTAIAVVLAGQIRKPKQKERSDNVRYRVLRCVNLLERAGNRIPKFLMDDIEDLSREYGFSFATHYRPSFDEVREVLSKQDRPGDTHPHAIRDFITRMKILIAEDRPRAVEQLVLWCDGRQATVPAAVLIGRTLAETKDSVANDLLQTLSHSTSVWTSAQEQAIAQAISAINPGLTEKAWSVVSERSAWTMRRHWGVNGIETQDLIDFLHDHDLAEPLLADELVDEAYNAASAFRRNGHKVCVTPSPFELVLHLLQARIHSAHWPGDFFHCNLDYPWKGISQLEGSEIVPRWLDVSDDSEQDFEPSLPVTSTATLCTNDRIYEKKIVSHNPADEHAAHVYRPHALVEDLNAIAADQDAECRFYMIAPLDDKPLHETPFYDTIHFACLPPAVAARLSVHFGFPILTPEK